MEKNNLSYGFYKKRPSTFPQWPFTSQHVEPTYRTEMDFTKQYIKSYFGGFNTTYVNATIKSLLKLVRFIRAGVWVDQGKSIPVAGEQANWRKFLCS